MKQDAVKVKETYPEVKLPGNIELRYIQKLDLEAGKYLGILTA